MKYFWKFEVIQEVQIFDWTWFFWLSYWIICSYLNIKPTDLSIYRSEYRFNRINAQYIFFHHLRWWKHPVPSWDSNPVQHFNRGGDRVIPTPAGWGNFYPWLIYMCMDTPHIKDPCSTSYLSGGRSGKLLQLYHPCLFYIKRFFWIFNHINLFVFYVWFLNKEEIS